MVPYFVTGLIVGTLVVSVIWICSARAARNSNIDNKNNEFRRIWNKFDRIWMPYSRTNQCCTTYKNAEWSGYVTCEKINSCKDLTMLRLYISKNNSESQHVATALRLEGRCPQYRFFTIQFDESDVLELIDAFLLQADKKHDEVNVKTKLFEVNE